MGGGKRKGKLKSKAAQAKENKQEAIRAINNCLIDQPVDIEGLRQLAILQGFLNNQLRSRVWPILIGVRQEESPSEEDLKLIRQREHRDSHVVECDIQRSLWAFTEGWSEEARRAKREELRAVLGFAVSQEGQEVYYYQGLHDIASVLLFVTGVQSASNLLSSLAITHLRDFTRSSLDAALELLSLLPKLLFKVDGALAQHIQDLGIPPFYALSWLITWFSHTVQSLPKIARAFDVLLASHPLMPLYMCAAIMQGSRIRILQEDDPSEMHRLLTNLPVFEQHSVDEIALEAYRLLKACPPIHLEKISGQNLQMATAPNAKLESGRWVVPDKKYRSLGLLPRQMALTWSDWLVNERFGRTKKRLLRDRLGPMSVIGGVAFLSSGLLAMYMSQFWQG